MSVNLEKGQRISLEKDGGKLSKVFMGLGWDAAKDGGGVIGAIRGAFGGGSRNIDLDASCALFSGQEFVDVVYFGQLRSKDGSITHTGDNLTGDGDGDDEVIRVDLSSVPQNIDAIVFTVSSYQGQTFKEIANASCRLVDETTGKELAKYDISGGGDYTGLIMAKLYRHNGEWKLQAVGESMQAKTVSDMVGPIRSIL